MSNVSRHSRPAQACERCRKFKSRCDKTKPRCTRCSRAKARCEYPNPKPSLADSTNVNSSAVLDEAVLLSPRDNAPYGIISEPENGQSGSGLPQSSEPASNFSNNNVLTERPRRKRERVTLSCLRCRQHKVRCDRHVPCGRCRKLNKCEECVYPHSTPEDTTVNLEDEKMLKLIATTFVDSKWDERFRNGAHWTCLLYDMGDLPTNHGKQPKDEPIWNSKTLSINFPFCEDEGSGDLVKDLLSGLPSPTMQKVFIDHYKNTIDRVYHLIDNNSWDQETQAFWEQSSVFQYDWLAQYFTVLSLGCQAYNFTNQGDVVQQFEDLPQRLLNGAKICLQRSPFMFRPSLANIRTLCLMVITKQVYTMSCHEADTCWPLLGVAVRLSISMGLHLNDSQGAQLTLEDGGANPNIKLKLWETVVLLEMRQSMACGMPLLLRSEGLNIGSLFDGCGELLMRALEIATSQEDIISYSAAVEIDGALREHLRLYNAGNNNLEFPTDDHTNPIDLEACKTEIFYRQVLMALHSRFALATESASRFPISYFSSLESALALLSKQRLLCDGGPLRKQHAWLAGSFRHEFFTAAMVVCCQLVRGTQSFATSSTLDEKTPADIMLDALESCRDIWMRERQMSVCSSNAFIVTDNLVRVLRGRV